LTLAVYGVATLRWRREANAVTYRQAHVAGVLSRCGRDRCSDVQRGL